MYCRGWSSPASAPGSAVHSFHYRGGHRRGEEKDQYIGGVFVACFSGEPSWDWNHLDHSSAAKLLVGQLPNVDAASLEPFGSGDFCLAFKLRRQVFRIARHVEAAEALRRESCILSKIAPLLPLPVPQPTYHAPPKVGEASKRHWKRKEPPEWAAPTSFWDRWIELQEAVDPLQHFRDIYTGRIANT